MRTNIHNWKTDKPLSLEEKLIYNDKYHLADISPIVKNIATFHFKKSPVQVKATSSSGDHYTYLIKYPLKTIFFRSDDGKIDDDYMDAEAAAINLAKKQGLPVPKIYATDTSKSHFPLRYQLMEKVPGTNLKDYYQAKTLARPKVSRQLGQMLARLHQIKLNNFGFINTGHLKRTGGIIGLNNTNSEYVFTKLSEHLSYLKESGFLTQKEIKTINKLFRKHNSYLEIAQGSLIHKDPAFWNMVGTPTKINGLLDWDDVMIGDPIDDISIIKCFYEDDVFLPFLKGYQDITPLPENFYPKLWLYLTRNMIWKSVFRIMMKYFDLAEKVATLGTSVQTDLRQYTYDKLMLGVNNLQKI